MAASDHILMEAKIVETAPRSKPFPNRSLVYIDRIIGLIIRDVGEIERDPLPEQSSDEMRVTAEELHEILSNRLK